jgi:hypothetical protein
MKYLIKKILLEETNDKPLSDVEIILFEHLNSVKETQQTKNGLISEIKTMCDVLGLDPNKANYYYELYTLNYREDNDYGALTFQNFKGKEYFSPQRTANSSAWEYTRAKMPFKGSNLKGYWTTDNRNIPFYVVISWNWYPVFIFKDDRWYKVNDTYSSSTAKQMSHANPVTYESNLKNPVILASRNQMDMLMRSGGYEDVMQDKVKKLLSRKSELVTNKTRLIKSKTEGVKYQITDVTEDNNKVNIKIKIIDGGKVENNSFKPSNGGYLRDELPGITKESLENLIKFKINNELTDYVGDIKNKNITFTFIHNFE